MPSARAREAREKSDGNAAASHASARASPREPRASASSVTRGNRVPAGANGHSVYTSPSLPSRMSASAPQPCGGANAKSTISGRSGYGDGFSHCVWRPQGSSRYADSGVATFVAASKTRSVPSESRSTRCPSPLGCHCARSTRQEWCAANASSRSETRAHRGSSGSSGSSGWRPPSSRRVDERDRRHTTASALLGGARGSFAEAEAREVEDPAACRKPPIAAKRPEGDTHSVRGSKSIGGSGRNVSTASPTRSPPPFGVSVEASRGSTAPRAAALTCLADDARTVPSAPSAYRVPRPSSHSTLGAGDSDGSICSPLARTQCDKSASIASRASLARAMGGTARVVSAADPRASEARSSATCERDVGE